MADQRNVLFLSFAFVSCFIVLLGADEKINNEEGAAICVYYGNARIASPQASLSNCSWYSNMACCRRTEVTSVFGGMYAPYGASQACQDRLNYMMCYFCSPSQRDWYDERLLICSEFCEDTFDRCKEAEYRGKSFGQMYKNGRKFCEAQAFQVVPGRQGCFNFDPSVFGSGHTYRGSVGVVLILLLSAYLIVL
ncbi:uncharacterized protein [Ptychodera flava]|uniref:uncharacterized protein n=1 Tax=Ptychodera flava TaxID=63121 RepID=UPI003969D66F